MKPNLFLTVIPLPYHNDDAFWGRDMGLLALGMRSCGVDARVVALGERERYPADLPLILGTMENFKNPLWWQNLNPAGVVLNTWSAPRYNEVRKAALSATPNVLEKLDTDGIRSPRMWLWKSAYSTFGSYLDSGNSLKTLFAPVFTGLRVLASYMLIDRNIARAMNLMPVLAAESPLAAERMRRFMRLYFKQIPRIVCIPHPVADDYMQADSAVLRENRIVCVGRWNAFQKNFPMLLDVLEKFLAIHSDWSVDVIGRLPNKWKIDSRFKGALGRIQFHGPIERREICAIYQKSKVFFMSSRYESFNIAAAEALCCGCSVVGSGEIASVPFFTSKSSGTTVSRQTRDHFLDGLSVEVEAWKSGERNPEIISKEWTAVVGSKAVGKKMLEYLSFGEISTSLL